MDEKKPSVTRTQFGELEERHSTFEESVNRRFDKQDRKLLDLETMGRLHGKQIESQSKDLQANTQATQRTERAVNDIAEKTADFVGAADYAKKTFALVEWVIKRLLPLAFAVGALLAGSSWLTKN